MTGPARLARFVESHVARRAPLEKQAREASWQLSVTGEAKWASESERLERELKTLLSDRAAYAELRGLAASGEIREPVAKRELDILLRDYAGNQVDESLLGRIVALEVEAEAMYARFRPEVGGRPLSENEIRDVLRQSDDEDERRVTWEASKRIGKEMAPLVLELVGLRNRAARELGHRDHYAMSLALQEMDEAFLFRVLDHLEELTREPFDELIGDLFARLSARFGISSKDVRPWHAADPFFQEAVPPADLAPGRFYVDADLVALTKASLRAMGFDIERTLARSDLFPRERKNQHAFCTHVDRAADDVRVLCNVVPNEQWMDTMLHEFGHAVYDQGLGEALPWLLRMPAHTLSTEAIALLFGRLAANPDWIVRRVGAPAAQVDPMREGLARHARARQLLFPRWVMVMCHFERAMYADPSADLGKIWWDLVERFQKIPRPENRREPDWACKVHVALAPVYYHNYLLGDLMASQLTRFLEKASGPLWFEDETTAKLLGERLFRHGALRPWNEALVHATGSPLDPACYVEQYVTAG
ncbi:MAG: M2 family metallopeptidase [Candidatus Eiseniibacteriota bacterium]